MPSSRQARMIRTAISPRLAIEHASGHGAIRLHRVHAGLPLLEERPHAFLALGRHSPAARSPRRVSDVASVGRRRADLGDQLLGGGDRAGRGREDLVDIRGDGRVELVVGTTACTSPIASRARGSESRAGQEQLARGRPSDLRDHERRDDRRDHAQPDLGETEHRVVRGDDDVADRGKAGPTAERGAVDAADDRHGQRSSAWNIRAISLASSHVLIVACKPAMRRHPLEIGAGAEGRAGARRERRARTEPSHDTEFAHQVSSAIISSLNALRTSGRLSTSRSIGPSRRMSRCT